MFASSSIIALSVFSLLSQVSASPALHKNATLNSPRKIGKRCTGEITSLSDVAAAEECDTIVVSVASVNLGYTEDQLLF